MNRHDGFETWDGIRFEVIDRPAADSDALVMEFTLPSGCGAPPPHVHDSLTETYEVLEGEVELLVGDEWRTLGEGDAYAFSPGERHSFRNESGSTSRVRNTHEPHRSFEPFIRSYAALTHEMEAPEPKGLSSAVKGAMLWTDYSEMGRVADRPLRVVFAVLSRTGRALGISYPEG